LEDCIRTADAEDLESKARTPEKLNMAAELHNLKSWDSKTKTEAINLVGWRLRKRTYMARRKFLLA